MSAKPLVFLSVCQRTSSAAMLHCRPITHCGGGGDSGRRKPKRESDKHDSCRSKGLFVKEEMGGWGGGSEPMRSYECCALSVNCTNSHQISYYNRSVLFSILLFVDMSHVVYMYCKKWYQWTHILKHATHYLAHEKHDKSEAQTSESPSSGSLQYRSSAFLLLHCQTSDRFCHFRWLLWRQD